MDTPSKTPTRFKRGRVTKCVEEGEIKQNYSPNEKF